MSNKSEKVAGQSTVGQDTVGQNTDKQIRISNNVSVPVDEIEMTAVRAQGAGGQNVNKTSSAIQLRYDIRASSLPDVYKERLLALSDHRITQDGVVVIKAQEHRTQDKNRGAALSRLQQLIMSVSTTPKKRRPTKPSRGAKERRLAGKKQRSQTKALRRSVDD